MEKLVKDVGGHVFKMPQPETPKQVIENGWFSPDWYGTCITKTIFFSVQQQNNRIYLFFIYLLVCLIQAPSISKRT
jgi:hypothetical protein